MRASSDRPFDWIAGLALASGGAVVISSLIALVVALAYVAMLLL